MFRSCPVPQSKLDSPIVRPLIIKFFSGALYHVTSRGNDRDDIYLNKDVAAVGLRRSAISRSFQREVHAYWLAVKFLASKISFEYRP